MIGISGAYYFVGGIAMNITGIAEFVLGNCKFLSPISTTIQIVAERLTGDNGIPFPRLHYLRQSLVQRG
jgi:hypothetical protein